MLSLRKKKEIALRRNSECTLNLFFLFFWKVLLKWVLRYLKDLYPLILFLLFTDSGKALYLLLHLSMRITTTNLTANHFLISEFSLMTSQ